MNTHIELIKKFEQKFGFETYNELTKIMGKMYNEIERLKESRDTWRTKYVCLLKEMKEMKR